MQQPPVNLTQFQAADQINSSTQVLQSPLQNNLQPTLQIPPQQTIQLPNQPTPQTVNNDQQTLKDNCNPCKKQPEVVDKCKKDKCSTNSWTDTKWGWLGTLLLWFIIFIVIFWLIFYSLKPPFVLQTDSNQVDTAKVLLAAVIAALLLIILVWLIKLVIAKRY